MAVVNEVMTIINVIMSFALVILIFISIRQNIRFSRATNASLDIRLKGNSSCRKTWISFKKH